MKQVLLGFAIVLIISGCGNSNSDSDDLGSNQNEPDFKIDVLSAKVDGSITLNSGAFPASQYQHGLISFNDADSNQTTLSETYNGDYDVSVVAGDYSVLYELVQGAGFVPSNKSETVSSGHTIDVDQTLDIDVVAKSVRFQFTLDGGPFPVTEYDDAVFYLRPQGGGERILLGNSHSPMDLVLLMHGTYDVIYELETGGNLVPVNQNAVIATVVVDSMTSGINIDVKTTDLRLTATLDGMSFPVSQYNYGRFMLMNGAGDKADLGKSYDPQPLSVKVIQGSYDIVFNHVNGTSVPANAEAIIASNVDISANPAQVLDVQTALVTPQYSLDGGAFPINEYQDAEVYLRGFSNNDITLLGNTHDANPSAVKVVRGDYDVIYRHESGDEVPLNKNAVIQSGTSINANQILAIDVDSATITATFTLNGEDFPPSIYQEGQFYLIGQGSDDELLLGSSFDGSGTVKIIPGTYDIIYRHIGGSQIPQNAENTILAATLLDVSKSIPINVDAKNIKPAFTLNGGPFPASAYENAGFYLHGATEADRIFLGRSYQSGEELSVIPGTYDVFYEYIQGNSIPINSRKQVDTININ